MIKIDLYNKEWPEHFELEKSLILKAVKNSGIEKIEIVHVGSTSVPGLQAKPTIDICIGVSSFQAAEQHILPPLQKKLNYQYLKELEEGTKGIPDRRYLQKLNDQDEHLFHVHIVLFGDTLWDNYITFRDYLINHPQEAEKYTKLKNDLEAQFSHDRKAYTEGKANFIEKTFYSLKSLQQKEIRLTA